MFLFSEKTPQNGCATVGSWLFYEEPRRDIAELQDTGIRDRDPLVRGRRFSMKIGTDRMRRYPRTRYCAWS